MPTSLFTFLDLLRGDLPLTATVLLTLGVLLVNGWTDAPNAITCAVVTGAMTFSGAAALAAACNFLGVLTVTAVNASVARTVYEIADFGGDARAACIALCAAMAAIVLWATAAWVLGIPTSESHALIAGVSGASVALQGSLSALHGEGWLRVLLGLVLSAAAGFLAGRGAMGLAKKMPGDEKLYCAAQLPGAALTAFLHGAQDGQKFLGIFLLGVSLARGRGEVQTLSIPLWLTILCAGTMGLGTALGGRRIIDTVGRDMVELTPRRGFAADLAGCGCLLAATLWGLPVSTTHTRTAALLGAAYREQGRVDLGVARRIVLAWLLTFPGCGLIGFVMARVFLTLFS